MLSPQAIQSVQQYLAQFAAKDDFEETIESIFGTEIDRVRLVTIRKQWLNGDLSTFPPIEIRPRAEINGADGAFAVATGKIYLAQELVQNRTLEEVVPVLLEEYGHSVDAQLNAVDAPGDEGAIFSALVRGETLNASQLSALKTEDDTATVQLDGQSVQIEQASATGSNPFYKYDIIAKTGDQGIQKIENRTSINDLGKVAFVGDLNTSVFGLNGIFIGDSVGGSVTLTDIAPSSKQSNRQFGTAVQINNNNQVIGSWRETSGTSNLRLFNGNTTNSSSLIASGGGSQTGFSYPFDYFSILPINSVNNNGESVFVAFDKVTNIDIFSGQLKFELGDRNLVTGSAPPSPSFNESLLPGSATVFTEIADDGSVLVSESQSGIRAINLYNNQLSTAKTIAITSPNGFTQLGNSPGISDDGSIVVFAGDHGNGLGIFASIDTGSAKRELITIAGENSIKPNPELGYSGASISGSDLVGTPIYFQDFDLNSRIGVSHVASGATGILGDTFTVSFIGTPSKPSLNNSKTGKPLLFSDQKGLWTVKVKVDSRLDGKPGFDFNQTSAIPVVQVGDIINGATVKDVSVYDPIANVGLKNPAIDSHQIAFVANTTAGEMVVKAKHLDTDGDGLLDDWEENGIDIDGDGNIDLDLKAMGADKNKQDLFLEIDWLAPTKRKNPTTGKLEKIDFSPDPAALDFIVDVFKNKGITLHIDAGAKSGLSRGMGTGSLQGGDPIGKDLGVHYDLVYFDAAFPGGPPPGFDSNGDGAANYRSFQSIKDTFFGTTTKNARELAFRYVVFADESGSTLQGQSGIAEFQEKNLDPTKLDFRSIPGNDLIVSLKGLRNVKDYVGVSFPVPVPAGFLQGQTLLHELGHTLGLRHGGQDNTEAYPLTSPKYNPGVKNSLGISLDTYKSVMNYLYQLYPDTTNLKLIQDYSSSSPFSDWSNLKLGFSDYFTTLGNSYGIFSQSGISGGITDPQELTVKDIIQILGPNALDDQVPTISTLSVPVSVNVGNPLTVEVVATDNIGIATVAVSFDLNGDGVIDALGETVTATQVGADRYQATFTNIVGSIGTRTVTAIATDLANFITTDTATVTVKGVSSNNPPVANADNATTNEDTPININVLANDSDANGDPLTLSLATPPTNGIATLNDNGTPANPSDDFIAYTPNANFNGSDTFTYQVSDGKATATATVAVTITPVNDDPITQANKSITIVENAVATPLSIAAPTDVDGDALTLAITTLPDRTKGKVQLANGTDLTANQSLTISDLTGLIFSPTSNVNGAAGTFSYSVNDGNGGTAAQIVTLDITPDGVTRNGTPQADNLVGTAGNDTIFGFAGNDTLYGEAGNDIIFGGAGVDLLFGGAGKDVFGFNNPTEGIDKINDFEIGSDLLSVSRAGFGGDSVFSIDSLVGGVLDVSRFTLGTSATSTSQRFIYNNASGALFFDTDGFGGTAQVRIAQLVGNPDLTNASFVVI
jgi:VCBS repeat-containing protein